MHSQEVLNLSRPDLLEAFADEGLPVRRKVLLCIEEVLAALDRGQTYASILDALRDHGVHLSSSALRGIVCLYRKDALKPRAPLSRGAVIDGHPALESGGPLIAEVQKSGSLPSIKATVIHNREAIQLLLDEGYSFTEIAKNLSSIRGHKVEGGYLSQIWRSISHA